MSSTDLRVKAETFITQLNALWPDFYISVNEYLHPTSEVVKNFLLRFFTSTLNIHVDDLAQKALQNMSPEIRSTNEDMVYDVILIKQLRIFLARIKVPEHLTFLSDVRMDLFAMPDPKQVHMIFRFIQNFVMFSKHIEPELDEIVDRYKQKALAMEQYTREINELQSELNTLSIEHAELSEETSERLKELEIKKKQYEKSFKEFEEAKRITDELLAVKVRNDNAIKDLEEEMANNVPQLKKQHRALKEESNKLVEKNKKITELIRNKASYESSLKANIQEIESCKLKQKVKEVLDQSAAVLTLEKKIKEMEENSKVESAVADIKGRQVLADKAESEAIEKEMINMEKQWKVREFAMQRELKETKEEVSIAEVKRNKMLREIDELDKEDKDLKNKIRQFELEEEKYKQVCLEKYDALLKAQARLNESRQNSIKRIKEKKEKTMEELEKIGVKK